MWVMPRRRRKRLTIIRVATVAKNSSGRISHTTAYLRIAYREAPVTRLARAPLGLQPRDIARLKPDQAQH